jgi:hypothetical protein
MLTTAPRVRPGSPHVPSPRPIRGPQISLHPFSAPRVPQTKHLPRHVPPRYFHRGGPHRFSRRSPRVGLAGTGPPPEEGIKEIRNGFKSETTEITPMPDTCPQETSHVARYRTARGTRVLPLRRRRRFRFYRSVKQSPA